MWESKGVPANLVFMINGMLFINYLEMEMIDMSKELLGGVEGVRLAFSGTWVRVKCVNAFKINWVINIATGYRKGDKVMNDRYNDYLETTF